MHWELLSGTFKLNLEQEQLTVSCSHKKAVEMVDKVNESHAWKIEDMQVKVGEMLATSVTAREKSACASAGAEGFSLYSDNVGKVINPRWVYNIFLRSY